jgi:xanthine phosphoribosyltransferase
MNSRTFPEIMQRFAEIGIDETFDLIVAIANGGLVPTGILNQRLQLEVKVLRINFKDENQRPRYERPKLLQPVDFDFKDKKILLVDDRIKSGSTIVVAREILKDAREIKTFAVNGNADYALFNEDCFRFPWMV